MAAIGATNVPLLADPLCTSGMKDMLLGLVNAGTP